jgi:hypothetical protein
MRSTQVKHRVAVGLVAAVSALLLTGCPQKPEEYPVSEEGQETPNQPSSDIRITIQSFGFMDVLSDGSSPQPAPPEAGTEEMAASTMEAAAAAEAEEEGEEMLEEEGEGPAQRGTVFLEYLVEYFGQDPAPEGVDVEIVQKGADGDEKGRYDLWVVTDGLTTGVRQVDVGEIEVDNYEDGDAFSVESSVYIPPEAPGEYREFAEAAPGD